MEFASRSYPSVYTYRNTDLNFSNGLKFLVEVYQIATANDARHICKSKHFPLTSSLDIKCGKPRDDRIRCILCTDEK